MVYLLNMVIFYSYVKLPEGTFRNQKYHKGQGCVHNQNLEDLEKKQRGRTLPCDGWLIVLWYLFRLKISPVDSIQSIQKHGIVQNNRAL